MVNDVNWACDWISSAKNLSNQILFKTDPSLLAIEEGLTNPSAFSLLATVID